VSSSRLLFDDDELMNDESNKPSSFAAMFWTFWFLFLVFFLLEGGPFGF